ncbi:1227_t:CDS:1, partial [Scutellospora calospora]
MSLSRFEQIVFCYTLMIVYELKAPNLINQIYSVQSFINVFNLLLLILLIIVLRPVGPSENDRCNFFEWAKGNKNA